MNDNYYQFITFTFNQQDIICEHLDSVSAQVFLYGKDKIVSIDIIDDSSNDNNVNVINDWITRNKHLFFYAKLHVNKENLGIKKNFLYSLSKVTSLKYKILGGDDTYIKITNVFNYMDYCSKKMIVFSPTLISKRFTLSQLVYIGRLIFYKRFSKILSRVINFDNPFSAPGSYISPNLIIHEYECYLLKSTENYEDLPSWRYFFTIKNINFDYFWLPIVDYRQSNKSFNGYERNKFYSAKSIFKISDYFKARFKTKDSILLLCVDLYVFFLMPFIVIIYFFKSFLRFINHQFRQKNVTIS